MAMGEPTGRAVSQTPTLTACACRPPLPARRLQVDLGRSPSVQELFVAEAERLHQLRHAHIVAL